MIHVKESLLRGILMGNRCRELRCLERLETRSGWAAVGAAEMAPMAGPRCVAAPSRERGALRGASRRIPAVLVSVFRRSSSWRLRATPRRMSSASRECPATRAGRCDADAPKPMPARARSGGGSAAGTVARGESPGSHRSECTGRGAKSAGRPDRSGKRSLGVRPARESRSLPASRSSIGARDLRRRNFGGSRRETGKKGHGADLNHDV
jgi:hypothetical protein